MARDFPIIAKLGGRKLVREHLARAGKPRSQKALEMWTFRRQIPGDIVTALWRIASEHGMDVEVSDFEHPSVIADASNGASSEAA